MSEVQRNILLIERMRPTTLDEVIGQQHLFGSGKPSRIAFGSGDPYSMILWGAPGAGKTTLARLMADDFHSECIARSAGLSGVKDIREAADRAQILKANSRRRTILFVDKVHRFSKYIKFPVKQRLINFICAIFMPWHSFQARSSMMLGPLQHG
jgi:putative ATPase